MRGLHCERFTDSCRGEVFGPRRQAPPSPHRPPGSVGSPGTPATHLPSASPQPLTVMAAVQPALAVARHSAEHFAGRIWSTSLGATYYFLSPLLKEETEAHRGVR